MINEEKIESWARESGACSAGTMDGVTYNWLLHTLDLVQFARLVRAAALDEAKEAVRREADEYSKRHLIGGAAGFYLAAEIIEAMKVKP